MLFNSFLFILIFLPIALAGWFGLNKLHRDRAAKGFLVLMSFWFYGMFGTQYIPVLLVSIFANYGFSALSNRISKRALGDILRSAKQAAEGDGAAPDSYDGPSADPYAADDAAEGPSADPYDDAADTSCEEEQWDAREDTGTGDPLDAVHQRIMAREAHQQHVLLFWAVLFNLAFLAVFKYADQILALVSGLAAGSSAPWLRYLPAGAAGEGAALAMGSLTLTIPAAGTIALPVGISFYTFSQISFIVDRCRGEIGHDGFLNYCTAMTFFPKLAEGPITYYGEIAPQFQDPERKFLRPDNFTRGLALFIFGMAKKMLLADNLAPAVNFGFSNTYYLDTLTVCALMMAYAFQLYFDFSGYIDMAMGVAQMFNIDLPRNFDSPYRATSFGRFWQRWHMTLTRFFTKYVYIPLGGSRHGTLRTMLNVMIVFILSGLWHGTGWTYLYWGVISGALVILCNNLFRRQADHARRPAAVWLLRILNYVMFCFTLVFFRADSLETALALLKRFVYPTWPGFLYRIAATLDMPELYILRKAVSLYAPARANLVNLEALLILLAICVVLVNGKRDAYEISQEMELRKSTAVLLGILFAWCLVSMSGVTTFLYFRF